MSYLGYMEGTLGSVHNWPRDILRYLFTLPPTYHSLRELATFFFGNGITLTIASEFIAECSHASQDDLDYVASKYALWTQTSDTPHLYEYYDMSLGQVFRVRVAEYSRERVIREESIFPVQIGLGYNVFPPHAIQRIDEMRYNSHWLFPFQMLLFPIIESFVGAQRRRGRGSS